tara:strand:- start:3732 stop:4424 length:693 start_codon:yes stop_codon:yes gene_type:complete
VTNSVAYLKRYGYNPGGGLLSPDGKYFLFQIPKNASTFLGNALVSNGWTFSNLSHVKDIIQLAVLRDPVDRWLSGYATYAALHLFGWGYGSDHYIAEYTVSPLVEKIIFSKLVFDDHTTPQIVFVNQLSDDDEVVYFDCERETLVDNLSKYTGLDIKITDAIIDNSREDNYDTKNLYEFFKAKLDAKSDYLEPVNVQERYLKNITLRERIHSVYKSDFKLIKQANFYYGT